MAKKKKRPKKTYRIKYGHQIDGSKVAITVIGREGYYNKKQAIDRIRKDLARVPYAKASLQVSKKSGLGWKPHSSYKYRKNKKTGRMRLVKL